MPAEQEMPLPFCKILLASRVKLLIDDKDYQQPDESRIILWIYGVTQRLRLM